MTLKGNAPPIPDKAAPRGWIWVVGLGAGAGCISALQPLLLNLLLGAHRLTIEQIGMAATIESAGMAIAVTLAALLLPLHHLRRIASLALLAMLFANLGTTLTSGGIVVALRLVSGLGAGTLLWILIGLFTRVPAPARTFGIYVTAQSILGLVLSQLMIRVVVPLTGYAGGYLLLCVTNGLLLGAVAMMPDDMGGRGTTIRGAPPLVPGLAIMAISAYLAAVMAVWVYILPLLHELGHPATSSALAVPAAITGQIVGGLAATLLAPRIAPLAAWLGGTVILAVAIAGLVVSHGTLAMMMLAGTIGFVWIFVPPFHMPVIIALDPSGRGPMLVGTAQLAGCSLGPFAASRLVTGASVLPVISVSGGFIALGLVLLGLAVALHRRRSAVTAAVVGFPL